MTLASIHQSLSDPTRLRILHLLGSSPLCVQHLQAALEANQVQVSKHLLLLKASGLVECQKLRNWRLYRLPEQPTATVRRSLDCMLACIREEQLFQDDLERLRPLRSQIQQLLKPSGKPAKPGGAARPRRVPILPAPPPSSPGTDALEDHLL